MSSTVPLGRFVWHELLTTDPAGAAAFYASVLGWSTRELRPVAGAPPYTLWSDGAGPLAGMTALSEAPHAAGASPYWLVHVSTPDPDATVARAWGLGARVLSPPVDLPGVGRVAVLVDPQGAAFAINGTPYPSFACAAWCDLAADDRDRAFAFYHDLFYWQTGDTFDLGPAGTYQFFGHGAAPLGGLHDRPAGNVVMNWQVSMRVADLLRALARVIRHGGRVLSAPMTVPGGDCIARCLDPQGAPFSLRSHDAA